MNVAVLDVDQRYTDLELLHPACRHQFQDLNLLLSKAAVEGGYPYTFTPFESYRTPWRQNEMVKRRTSKASEWQSPHQWGFAVDFVPRYEDGRWSWDDNHDWPLLANLAETVGLEVPIAWDLAHVESPTWRVARMRLRAR